MSAYWWLDSDRRFGVVGDVHLFERAVFIIDLDLHRQAGVLGDPNFRSKRVVSFRRNIFVRVLEGRFTVDRVVAFELYIVQRFQPFFGKLFPCGGYQSLF